MFLHLNVFLKFKCFSLQYFCEKVQYWHNGPYWCMVYFSLSQLILDVLHCFKHLRSFGHTKTLEAIHDSSQHNANYKCVSAYSSSVKETRPASLKVCLRSPVGLRAAYNIPWLLRIWTGSSDIFCSSLIPLVCVFVTWFFIRFCRVRSAFTPKQITGAQKTPF